MTATNIKGATSRFVHLKKRKPKFFKLLVCNPCQSSPSLTILVPFWLILPILEFLYLTKLIFFGFPNVEVNFLHVEENDSKYHDVAPLKAHIHPTGARACPFDLTGFIC